MWVRIPLGWCALDTTIYGKVFSDLQPLVFFSGFSGFLHQQNWPPRCNWNIVESGFKHHNPNPNTNPINSWYKYFAIYHALKTREGVRKEKLDMVVSVELKKANPIHLMKRSKYELVIIRKLKRYIHIIGTSVYTFI